MREQLPVDFQVLQLVHQPQDQQDREDAPDSQERVPREEWGADPVDELHVGREPEGRAPQQ